MSKPNAEADLAVRLYKHRVLVFAPKTFKAAEPTRRYLETNTGIQDTLYDAAKLMSIARALSRLDEAACNRELSNRETQRILNLVSAAVKIVEEYGLKLHHNTDPRGFSLYIHFPDGSSNSWGGSETGWGI